jgi:DNA-binding MarR family transcriptional regulator
MSEQLSVSQQLVELFPLMMRLLHSDMRLHVGGMVPAHFRVLGLLAKHACTVSEIAEQQSVTMATMSNSVNTLVERGWIQRIPVSYDRRMVKVELTPAGKQILMDGQRRLEDMFSQRLEHLPLQELEELRIGLGILIKVLKTPQCNERNST